MAGRYIERIDCHLFESKVVDGSLVTLKVHIVLHD